MHNDILRGIAMEKIMATDSTVMKLSGGLSHTLEMLLRVSVTGQSLS